MGGPAVARLRDGTAVGAWLLKANPAVWDVGAFLDAGEEADTWRLAPTYRVDLLAVGQPVGLWITRGDPAHPPGLWAVGSVTGAPADDVGDPDDPRWRDLGARRQVRPYVPVRLRALDRPVAVEAVRNDPRLATTEIVRAPRVASPVAVTPEEWAALLDLTGPGPGRREYPLRP
ncbi:MAG: EVE domain-containing protein [Microthrixaceae bacterium]